MAAPSPRAESLRRRQDFVAVLRGGRRARERLVRLAVRGNGLEHNRYGFAVGRDVGTAVVRNRTRRRLREITRALALAPGHDIVITAQPESASASFGEVARSVESAAQRLRLMEVP